MLFHVPPSIWTGTLLTFLTLASFPQDVNGECGETVYLTAESHWQILTSYGYPNDYEPNLDICWKITAENARDIIELQVLDCSVEYSVECASGDFIEVRDGYQSSAPLLHRFCGTSEPHLVSTGRHVYIRFYTDVLVRDRGFKIRYIAAPTEAGLDDLVETSTPSWGTDSGCTQTFYYTAHDVTTEIQSPGFPFQYERDADLCWQLYAEKPRQLVRLEVYESQLQYSVFCSMADYVEVRDGASLWDPQIREWCGSEKPPIFTSSGQYLLIRFRSDNSNENEYKGFSAKFWTANEWVYDYYTVSSTTRTCIGLSVMVVAIVIITSVLAYHKKYRYRSRAVAISGQNRCNITGTPHQQQSHISHRNRHRSRLPSRPEAFPTNTRQYHALYSGPASHGFNNAVGVPVNTISSAAIMRVVPPQPPPYTPREAPPAYTPQPFNSRAHEGAPQNNTAEYKPPPLPSPARY